MLPVTLALAALLDESVTFDGVIRFDALQSSPGTGPGSLAPSSPQLVPPSTTLATATITICEVSCSSTTIAAGTTGLTSVTNGPTSAQVTAGTCGSTCTSSRRGLLQSKSSGNSVTYTITGATVAQLQALQNQISAGNLVQFGIPATAVIISSSPATGTFTFQASPTPLAPANPASPQGVALCNGTSLTKTSLPCTDPITCAAQVATLNANGITAICCACTGLRRALLQTPPGLLGTFSPTGAATLPQICAVLGNVNGCGKQSKKGLLGLLGLLGLIPLFLVLLLCCLCLLRRKRRGQAMMFSQTHQPAPVPLPPPAHLHGGPVPPAF